MGKAFALSCLYAARLCASVSPASDLQGGVAADACGLGGAGCLLEDAVALLQRDVQKHNHQEGFPDFGDLADQAQDIVGQASDAVNDLLAKGISTVGSTMNTTLAKLDGEVSTFSAEVNQTAEELRLGMASLLSKKFNVSLPAGLPSGEEYEKVVKEKIDSAVALFSSAVKSMEGAVGTTSLLPSGVEDLTQSLNSTLHKALSECQSLLGSLKDVQALVEAPQQTAAKALLQAQPQAGVEPKEAAAKVKAALRSASEQVSGFSSSFVDGFDKLSDSVLDATKGKLGAEAQGQLSDSFAGVAATARHLGSGVQQGVGQLLDSLGQGIDAAGLAGSGAPARAAAARLGLFAALLGAAAAGM